MNQPRAMSTSSASMTSCGPNIPNKQANVHGTIRLSGFSLSSNSMRRTRLDRRIASDRQTIRGQAVDMARRPAHLHRLLPVSFDSPRSVTHEEGYSVPDSSRSASKARIRTASEAGAPSRRPGRVGLAGRPASMPVTAGSYSLSSRSALAPETARATCSAVL